MTPDLQRRFNRVEEQRRALQSSVQALSDAQRNWTPGTDTWSVRQIVHHLMLSDETVGRACPAGAVPTEALMFRALPRAVRRALVMGALRRDKTLPLPSPDVEPRGEVPLPELLGRWEAARAAMGRALDTLPGEEARYFHPVLGPLSAAQMLDLAQAHMAYHARQIEVLQSNPAFPGSSAAKL